jgi:hypothetical protein
MVKGRVFCIIVTALVLFAGCGFGTIEDMLSPPRLTDEQQAIYTALVESRGTGFKLKYPRTGEHRSAFVVYGRDAENPDSAMVFYEISGTALERSLRMNFLFKNEQGVWESLLELPVTGTDIESVNFIEFGEEEEMFVFLSYTISHNEKAFMIISGIHARPFIQHGGIYSFMHVDYFFERDRKELLIIKNDLQSAEATFYNYKDGLLMIDGSSAIDPSAGDYLGITQGNIAEGIPALFINHRKHGSSEQYGTDLLYLRRGRVVNPMANPEHGDMTLRITNSITELAEPRDIDGDGFIEFPSSVGDFPGYSHLAAADRLRPVLWRKFANMSDRSYAYYTYYSGRLDYVFFFPSRWVGSVTVIAEPEGNIVGFYAAAPLITDVTELLLSIQAIPNHDGGFSYIKETPNPENPLSLTDEELEKAFRILSEIETTD